MPSWSVLTSGWGKRTGRERGRKKAGRGRDLRLDSRERGRLKEGGGGMKEQKRVSCLILGEAKEGNAGL